MSVSSIQAFVHDLRDMEQIGPHIVHEESFPGNGPAVQDVRSPWSAQIQALLRDLGISGLYSHQVQAIDHIRSGQHTVAATPTASGKSLIYCLPVLERIGLNPSSRSLFLFPLKALAQDQLRAFQSLAGAWAGEDKPRAAVYDGDTPAHRRAALRKSLPHVLLTNPEMLHLSLLSSHQQWASLWSNLDFVVVDEVHTYRGVMGSNMAWVFRRLRRMCALHGSDPTFIFCSATIGNPGQLAHNLTGLPVQVVEKSGAPQGNRRFLFVNPLHGAAGSALHLLQASLHRGLRTIIYTQSRKMTELLSMWAKKRFPEMAHRISAYRSGFLPSERREIEQSLSQGRILAVITTSALELGIDIGGLDVCILVGYPGSIMAAWQRGGRVGRQQQDSVVVLIGHEDNLDQYFMAHPEQFFNMPPEDAVINPTNPVIMHTHVQCAAADRALARNEDMLQEPGVQEGIERLVEQGLLRPSQDGNWLFASNPQVASGVNLRGSGRSWTIIDQGSGRAIGSIDHFRAFHETHPGAVYLHRGRTYLIDDMQAGNGTVVARQARVSYFTRVRTEKATEILQTTHSTRINAAKVSSGRLRVTVHITGYEKRSTRGHKLLGVVPLEMEPFVFETDGLWLEIDDQIRAGIESARLHFMGGIHALEHAMIGLMPLLVLADRNDLGGIAYPDHPQLGTAAVFVYDGVPGGVGLTQQAFRRIGPLLEQTLHALSSCTCEIGCPACVHSPKCGAGNRPLDKNGAICILQALMGVEMVPPAGQRAPDPAPSASASGAGEGRQRPKRRLRFVVLKLETQRSIQEVGGWHQAHQMGMSGAVLYDSRSESYLRFQEGDVHRLVDRLRAAELVVGFNIRRFDFQVLRGYIQHSLQRLSSLDLLLSITSRLGYGLSLDHLARATLGVHTGRSNVHTQHWWRDGRVDRILDSCQEAVAVTLGLYLHGRDNGYVLFRNKAGNLVELPVDWAQGVQ